MLQQVAVRLERVARRSDGRRQALQRRPEDLGLPAPGRLRRREPVLLVELQPGPVLAKIVEQQARLALEGDEAGSPLQLPGVEVAAGDGGAEVDAALGPGLELDLADGEAEVVEAAHVDLDGEAVSGLDLDLAEQLLPEQRVAGPDRLGRLDLLVHRLRPPLEGGQVGQPEGDVLDQHVEVVGALPVGQDGMDLARLRVHEIRGVGVAVAPEERVGE